MKKKSILIFFFITIISFANTSYLAATVANDVNKENIAIKKEVLELVKYIKEKNSVADIQYTFPIEEPKLVEDSQLGNEVRTVILSTDSDNKEVYAISDGIVFDSGYEATTECYYLIIKQNDGIYTQYSYLNKESKLSEGSNVEQGAVIGETMPSDGVNIVGIGMGSKPVTNDIDPVKMFNIN